MGNEIVVLVSMEVLSVNDLFQWISSLNFLSEVLGNTELDESLTNTIITLLKKGSRDKSQSLSLMCINHLFKLLNNFSLQKSNFAPLIYKKYIIYIYVIV